MNTLLLLHQCGQGDSLAIEQLVNEYHPMVYRLACSILDDGSENGICDADEAAQDVLLAALESLAAYRGESTLTTWLYAITVNACRDRLRKRRTRERLAQAVQALTRLAGGHSVSPEEETIHSEGEAAIRQAVNTLGEKQRIPIILRYYHEFSVREIAEMLGINEGTVCSRLSIGRDQLRARLGNVREKEVGR